MSNSSAKLVQKRTLEFCATFDKFYPNIALFEEITKFLNKEYNIIPTRERIGKGIKFIAKHVAKSIFQCLKKSEEYRDKEFIINFIDSGFIYGESEKSFIMQHFALHILAEFIFYKPGKFDDMVPLVENYACHEDWSVRETTADSIISGLQKIPEETLKLLLKWTKNEDENLRRIASESLRPHSAIKWLRDSTKNDQILEILTVLREDKSIYVRKSVGNNLKDLTKYMPEKILKLVESWIDEANIEVHDELAMELGLNKKEKRLIWTIKHAMRWIKNRVPELHPKLEKILGKNYLLYFNEKRNRLAKPVKKD